MASEESLALFSNINSVINGYMSAGDNTRPYTYIEFIKLYGFEHNADNFIKLYQDYLTLWAQNSREDAVTSDKDFVKNKMIDILKSITLTYSTFEEQDFIANIDWTDDSQIKSVIPFYIRKIQEITEYYRKKRENIGQIINKHKFKGSTKSVEEIIYDTIIKFIFDNKSYLPQMAEIKRDLSVSIESYVDTYSEYFDIPRDSVTTKRKKKISASMNDVDYKQYLEVGNVISNLLYSGYTFLKEIPLIARLGIDLSAQCVGDMAVLRDKLLMYSTLNQVALTEQVALKRKLYKKYLGCDLYYLFCDAGGNVTMDLLTKASNPSGNLLNCSTADTATTESDQLELLSNIGLFFKPDKTGILKVSAKDFSWEIDKENLTLNTIYIFPDPNRYGQIGNNKDNVYPLIMEYKFDYDIKNNSSGFAKDDILFLIDSQSFNSYYSKQQDQYKIIDNKDLDYSFTALKNNGFISNYQQDIFGNEFATLKGFNVTFKEVIDPETGETIVTDEIEKIEIDDKFVQETYHPEEYEESVPNILINGGYFEDPFHQGLYTVTKKQIHGLDSFIKLPIKNINFLINKYCRVPADICAKLKENYCNLYQLESEDVGDSTILRLLEDYIKLQDYPKFENILEVICVLEKINSNPLLQSISDEKFNEIKTYIKKNNPYLEEPALDRITFLYDSLSRPNALLEFVLQLSYTLTDRIYNPGAPFDFNKKLRLTDDYNWTGMVMKPRPMNIPSIIFDTISFGEFGKFEEIDFVDHYRYNKLKVHSSIDNDDSIIEETVNEFVTVLDTPLSENALVTVKTEKEDNTFISIGKEEGYLYVKNNSSFNSKPTIICGKNDTNFGWLKTILVNKGILKQGEQLKVQDYFVTFNTIILETANHYIFVPYSYRDNTFVSTLGINDLIMIQKSFDDKPYLISKPFYIEEEQSLYIAKLLPHKGRMDNYTFIPFIWKFNCKEYTIDCVMNSFTMFKPFATIFRDALKVAKNNTDRVRRFERTVSEAISSPEMLMFENEILFNKNNSLNNFEKAISYKEPEKIILSHNNNLKKFLISYIHYDTANNPYIFEHTFKLGDENIFRETLVTNVYTFNDKIYVYNEKLNGGYYESNKEKYRKVFFKEIF